jgi:hypothetical protein
LRVEQLLRRGVSLGERSGAAGETSAFTADGDFLDPMARPVGPTNRRSGDAENTE